MVSFLGIPKKKPLHRKKIKFQTLLIATDVIVKLSVKI